MQKIRTIFHFKLLKIIIIIIIIYILLIHYLFLKAEVLDIDR
jgi:hypothetical protein